ncbi:glycosyltransferase family A protein [Cereibacter sp. SYSU M97828]|nr:glycosyltransferase family A protein [Cereibacter flavus]
MLRKLKARWRSTRARSEIAARAFMPRPHGLSEPLTVTLTSYPARFGTLGWTLRSILTQTVAADRVVLWLADGDEARLPEDIRAIPGLEVRRAENMRSFTKIVPALEAFPADVLVTADDDVYYPADWLERLVEARLAGATVAAHRAHRVTLSDGAPRPYREWDWSIRAPDRSGLIFPTGVMGVLYAPGVFHADAADAAKFRRLCPSSDDIWLYWMHRLNGHRAAKIGGKMRVLEWPESQETNLRSGNLAGQGNDAAIRAMISEYGFPSVE